MEVIYKSIVLRLLQLMARPVVELGAKSTAKVFSIL